jgi:hypothetical protein
MNQLGLKIYSELGNLLLQMATGNNKSVSVGSIQWTPQDTFVITSNPYTKQSIAQGISVYYMLRFLHTDPPLKLFAIELTQVINKEQENNATQTTYLNLRIENVLALVTLLQEHGVPFDKTVRFYNT